MGDLLMSGWDLDDEVRLRAIGEADLFPGVPEPTFEPYARIVARLLDVPVALVSIVDGERQFFPAQVGVGEPWASRGETPLSMSICQHVVRGDAPLVVIDATGDDRVAGNLAIEELDVIAYIGVPVRAPGGEPLGSLCAITHHPRHWTDDELAVMEEVADAVAQLVAVRTSEHRWSRFAADASHRLRTPVAAMRLELDDLLTWSSLPDDVRSAVRVAADRAQELSGIVEDLSGLVQLHERLGHRVVVAGDVLRAALDSVDVPGSVDGDLDASVLTAPSVLRATMVELLDVLREAGAGHIRVGIESVGEQVVITMAAGALSTTPPLPASVRDRVVGDLRGRVTPVTSPAVGYLVALPR